MQPGASASEALVRLQTRLPNARVRPYGRITGAWAACWSPLRTPVPRVPLCVWCINWTRSRGSRGQRRGGRGVQTSASIRSPCPPLRHPLSQSRPPGDYLPTLTPPGVSSLTGLRCARMSRSSGASVARPNIVTDIRSAFVRRTRAGTRASPRSPRPALRCLRPSARGCPLARLERAGTLATISGLRSWNAAGRRALATYGRHALT